MSGCGQQRLWVPCQRACLHHKRPSRTDPSRNLCSHLCDQIFCCMPSDTSAVVAEAGRSCRRRPHTIVMHIIRRVFRGYQCHAHLAKNKCCDTTARQIAVRQIGTIVARFAAAQTMSNWSKAIFRQFSPGTWERFAPICETARRFVFEIRVEETPSNAKKKTYINQASSSRSSH